MAWYRLSGTLQRQAPRPPSGRQFIHRWLSVTLILLSLASYTQAQEQNTIFLTEGKIEFEKKINLYAQMDDNSWSELQKKTMPQFKTTYYDLLFTQNKTLFRPGRDNPDNSRLTPQPAEENTVYNDLDNEKTVSQKKVFEQLFLVEDSTRKIKWKITDEIRTIAGLECRRANAVIMDSIYVVAFYTDEIINSGGPESFTGLPGMILGVALPHQHVTWFATRVQSVKVGEGDLPIPQKGKKVNNSTLRETLTESLKNWDKKYARQYIQAMLL
jgi:GLPGLI family protein